MRNLTEANLTQAVIESMAGTPDARTKEILTSLVQHLHAFIREVSLTQEEWLAGIQFLTAVGHKSDDKRQEFILLSDTLGATTMKDLVNNPRSPGVTEDSVLGPFHRPDAPEMPLFSNMAGEMAGEPMVVRGRVLAPDGRPIANAALDVWHSDSEGHYDVQLPDMEGMALRGVFHTDAEGRYSLRTIKPAYYPVPHDGPVGQLLATLGRHPYRPAHIHFIVSAPGYKPVTTELYVAGDPYLDSDAVFGVRESLVVQFVPHDSEKEAAALNVTAPFYTMDFDFVLDPA